MSDTTTGLALLRQPFPPNQISYLPKGGVKLAYVGHAALTDRLLDADPAWSWEPLAIADGLPVMDDRGGMWIKLTVCGVTRLGYGHAGSKTGGDAIKEIIGDALRNAAMRFGAALDLWHKGDLHGDETQEQKLDMSPKARADRMRIGVAAGDAAGVAETLSLLPPAEMEAIMALMPQDTYEKVVAAWPEVKT